MEAARVLVGQFVVVRSADVNLYTNYSQSHCMSDWTLLTNTRLIDVNCAGWRVGWVIGVAIDDAGVAEVSLDLACEASDWEMIDEALSRLAGRWAAIIKGADGIRFYLDAGGTMAAVYSRERGILASTPSQITDGEPELRPQSFYGAGLTPWS